jgi:hypothetical protein
MGISHVLETMSTLPAFHDARHWVLRNLGISQGSSVIETGCGTAADLSDVLSTVGTVGKPRVDEPGNLARPTRDLRLATSARSRLQMARSTLRSVTRY